MRLKQIYIENVKSFRDGITISFAGDVTILVGPNASGKSNLLDIITVCIRSCIRTFRVDYATVNDVPRPRIRGEELFGGGVRHILEPYMGSLGPCRVAITLTPSKQDLINIQLIDRFFTEFSAEYEKHWDRAMPRFKILDAFKDGLLSEESHITYRYEENNFCPINNTDSEYPLHEYFSHCEMFVILSKGIPEVASQFASPYIFFSPYRSVANSDISACLSSDDLHNIAQESARTISRSTGSVVKLAALVLANKKRKYEIGSDGKGYLEAWSCDEQVVALTKYLGKLGYEWELRCTDALRNSYAIQLKREGRSFLLSNASSGEKEILNFLLGILVLNFTGSLVLIDEPELHLHPKWQSTLRDLLIDLSHDTSTQFVITTHSPMFINANTIENVMRVYKHKNDASKVVFPQILAGSAQRDLLHIINSHNNEKMFFSDTVVLVEGIQDRLVFERLLRYYQSKFKLTDIVEVLAVHGKTNFEKYKAFLAAIQVDTWIIADLDYVLTIGPVDIRDLFEMNEKKFGDLLLGKKSTDRVAFCKAVNLAIDTQDFSQLAEIRDYIKGRAVRIKSTLTTSESKKLEIYIEGMKQEKTFILSKGEIEEYLPEGYRSLEGTIALLQDGLFQEWIQGSLGDKECTQQLMNLTCKILDLNNNPSPDGRC